MFHQCSINSKLFCTFAPDNYKQRNNGKKILLKDKGNKGPRELIYRGTQAHTQDKSIGMYKCSCGHTDMGAGK